MGRVSRLDNLLQELKDSAFRWAGSVNQRQNTDQEIFEKALKQAAYAYGDVLQERCVNCEGMLLDSALDICGVCQHRALEVLDAQG